MDKKKIMIIATVAILLIFVGFLWFFSRQDPAAEGGFPLTGFPSGAPQDIGTGSISELSEEQKNYFEESSFVKLSQDAVSGAGALSSTTVRYIVKETGNIFDINIEEMNSERVSNTTIPKIFETIWPLGADKFVAKYMEDVEQNQRLASVMRIFLASMATDDEDSQVLEGVFLPQGVSEVTVSPDGERAFYLLEAEDMYYGFISDFNNDDRQVIYMSSYGDFNVSWPSENSIVLLTKPSSEVDGFVYFLNPKTERKEKIIGGVKGMTASVSPDAKSMIYSQSGGNLAGTKVLDIEEKSTTNFSIKTLPEKCVWSGMEEGVLYCGIPASIPRADYPDDWYKGKITFDDSIWKINISSGATELLLENSSADATNLLLTADDEYLVFINKKDNSLWSLKLKQ